MPIISFTKRDLLRGKAVEPSWYVVHVDSIGEGTPSTKGDSTNYGAEGTIIKAENGDTTYADTPIDWNFNSKFVGGMRGFLESLGVDIKENQRYELANAVGKKLLIFVENDEWQGRIINRVNHKYRKYEEQ